MLSWFIKKKRVVKIEKKELSDIRYIFLGIIFLFVAIYVHYKFNYAFAAFPLALAFTFLIIGAVDYYGHLRSSRKLGKVSKGYHKWNIKKLIH